MPLEIILNPPIGSINVKTTGKIMKYASGSYAEAILLYLSLSCHKMSPTTKSSVFPFTLPYSKLFFHCSRYCML